MSQLKRYNGSTWENVGGNVTPKTAKTTSDRDIYSCNYINTLGGTILWTNQSPTSSFSAQDITLSSSDYDVLEFFFTDWSYKYGVSSSKIIKGRNGNMNAVFVTDSNNTLYASTRIITYVNDTKYNISQASGNRLNSSTAEHVNATIVPIYVVGYKTGLF